MIRCEVAYVAANPVVESSVAANKEILLSLELAEGSTVRQGLLASQILKVLEAESIDAFVGLDELERLDELEGRVGIFGKLVSLDTRLKEGDRIEIYRFLTLDPKAARRKRGIEEIKQVKKKQRLDKAARRKRRRDPD